MDKTIIFLGAGASKADNAPLQAELFKAYVDCQKNKMEKPLTPSENQLKTCIFFYFRDFFGLDIDTAISENKIEDLAFPTFEEALGILDLAISKNEQYKNNTHCLQKIRNALIFSMASAIQYCLDFSSTSNIDQRPQAHHKLISQLKDPLLKKKIVLISTNYDLLVDNEIFVNDISCDYGFPYNEFIQKDTIRLLKIHGSLNWLFCPVCKQIDVRHGQKVAIPAMLNPSQLSCRCKDCKTAQQAIIVPPTYYKDMRNPYLQRVYEAAEQKLMSAKKIIFCGYSFPDADMHIKYLLKRAEQNGKHRTLDIKILNYTSKNASDEEKRYRRFFKDKQQLNYRSDIDFATFANNPWEFL